MITREISLGRKPSFFQGSMSKKKAMEKSGNEKKRSRSKRNQEGVNGVHHAGSFQIKSVGA